MKVFACRCTRMQTDAILSPEADSCGEQPARRDRAMQEKSTTRSAQPHVVIIVGGGFGGLGAARALRHAPVQVTVIDRTNHHLFQPLLYQVATAGLSPADIAAPIRHILRRQQNTNVVMAEVTGVDMERRRVLLL